MSWMSRREMLRMSATIAAAGGAPWMGGRAVVAVGRRDPGELPIGVCRSISEGAAAAAGGAAYLEVSCREWLTPDQPEAHFDEERLEAIRRAPIPVRAANSFLPGSLPCVGPGADTHRVLAYAKVAFRRAREAGIGIITFGSGASRRVPDGFPKADAELQFVALLARMAPLAAEHDIVVCVEPLQQSETNMINRVSEARRLVAAVRHPSLGITADLFHMMREEEGPDAIRKAGDLVRHVHIAERRRRTPPGKEGDDFRPYLRALNDIAYEGLVSIECRWGDLETELPLAIQTLRSQGLAGTP